MSPTEVVSEEKTSTCSHCARDKDTPCDRGLVLGSSCPCLDAEPTTGHCVIGLRLRQNTTICASGPTLPDASQKYNVLARAVNRNVPLRELPVLQGLGCRGKLQTLDSALANSMTDADSTVELSNLSAVSALMPEYLTELHTQSLNVGGRFPICFHRRSGLRFRQAQRESGKSSPLRRSRIS
jgi:hypothetical protein